MKDPRKRRRGKGWVRERHDLTAGFGCRMFSDQGENAQGEAGKSCSHGICFSIQFLLDPISLD